MSSIEFQNLNQEGHFAKISQLHGTLNIHHHLEFGASRPWYWCKSSRLCPSKVLYHSTHFIRGSPRSFAHYHNKVWIRYPHRPSPVIISSTRTNINRPFSLQFGHSVGDNLMDIVILPLHRRRNLDFSYVCLSRTAWSKVESEFNS